MLKKQVIILNFKLSGIILVLFAGAFCTYDVKMTFDKRIKILKIFYDDLNFIISKISYFKIPVNHIVKELMEREKNDLSEFYNHLYDFYLHKDEKSFKQNFLGLRLNLSKSDSEFLYEMFLKLGSYDYENEINNLNNHKERLGNIIEKAQINKQKNQKTKCTLTMCSFILIIIFFI